MPELSALSSLPSRDTGPILAWRVHLLRRTPQRLPLLLAAILCAALCVWLIFRSPLPALAAILLLVGSISEYLFPIAYRITPEGIAADAPTSHLRLRWKEARRCLAAADSMTITPLPVPSRLDAFRGVTLRFATEGEPGDRASVLAAVAQYAPDLLPSMTGSSSAAQDSAPPGPNRRASTPEGAARG